MKKLFLLCLPLIAISCSVRENPHYHDTHVSHRRVEPVQKVVVVNNKYTAPHYNNHNQPNKVVVVKETPPKQVTVKPTPQIKKQVIKQSDVKKSSTSPIKQTNAKQQPTKTSPIKQAAVKDPTKHAQLIENTPQQPTKQIASNKQTRSNSHSQDTLRKRS